MNSEVFLHFISKFKTIIVAIMFIIPRMTAFFMTAGFMGKGVISGLIRNVFIIQYSLFIAPVIISQISVDFPNIFLIMFLFIKEFFIGFLLGYITGIGFWAIESAGFFIDNQRGASIASIINPFSGVETSPLGVFFLQLSIIVFFVSHLFKQVMGIFFSSYVFWNVFTFFPSFSFLKLKSILFFLDILMYNAVLLASPVLIMMLLSEIGLAFANRFAPQLQVFFLAMPIKSGIAFFVLILYFWIALENMEEILSKYKFFLALLKEGFSRGS